MLDACDAPLCASVMPCFCGNVVFAHITHANDAAQGCLHLAPREVGDSPAPDALPRKGGSSATNAQQHTATASGTSKDANSPTSPYNQQPVIAIPSGTLANLYLFNLFGICIGFEKDADDKPLLLAATDVTLFSW